jgi:hypothetical protein
VVGDLEERYRNGKSRAWYWRQSITAIATSTIHEIRNHRLHSFRAALVGWVFLRYFLLPIVATIIPAIGNTFAPDTWQHWFTPSWFAIIGLAIFSTFAAGILSGWVVSHTHHGRRSAVFLHALTVLLLWITVTTQGESLNDFLLWLNIAGIMTGIFIGGLWLARVSDSEGVHA